MRQRLVTRQNIVGVQDPDHIASRHLDAFVDGVVHSAVLLADPLEREPCRTCRILFDYIDSAVGRTAVDDDVFDIDALLRQDAINRR